MHKRKYRCTINAIKGRSVLKTHAVGDANTIGSGDSFTSREAAVVGNGYTITSMHIGHSLAGPNDDPRGLDAERRLRHQTHCNKYVLSS